MQRLLSAKFSKGPPFENFKRGEPEATALSASPNIRPCLRAQNIVSSSRVDCREECNVTFPR